MTKSPESDFTDTQTPKPSNLPSRYEATVPTDSARAVAVSNAAEVDAYMMRPLTDSLTAFL